MDLSYEWKITAMKKAPSLDELSDVITHINFTYTGTDADSGESSVFNGACPIGLPDSENFTALADLTEADVIEWAKANHPTDHMNEVCGDVGKIMQVIDEFETFFQSEFSAL